MGWRHEPTHPISGGSGIQQLTLAGARRSALMVRTQRGGALPVLHGSAQARGGGEDVGGRADSVLRVECL